MSFLDKIKKFLNSEVEEKKEDKKELLSEEILPSLEQKRTDLERTIQEKTDNLYTEIQALVDQLEKDTEALSSIDLSEKKVEEQYKNISEVGRKDYLVILQNLIENLRKKKKGSEEIYYLVSELNNFIKNSQKSDFKATFLIGKEIEKIKQDIIQIRKLGELFVQENSQLLKDNNNVLLLLKRYEEIEKHDKQHLELVEEMKIVKSQDKKDEEKLREIETRIQLIKKSSEYEEQISLINKKEEKEKELSDLEFKIKTLLDNRIIEKYVYTETDREKINLAEKYIKDPLEALNKDSKLEIVNILKDIKEKIENSKIKLKEPNKAIEKITIEKEVFIEYKENIQALKTELKKLDNELNNIKIDLKKELKERTILLDKMIDNKNLINNLEKKQGELVKTIESLNQDLIKEIKEKQLL